MSQREAARRELIWRRYKNDPAAFAAAWTIQHPQGRRKLELYEPQREALAVFAAGGNVLTLKARQIGWSTLTSFYQFWLAFFHDDKRVLDISRGEREAADLLAKTRFGYDSLPKWLRARGPKLLNDNATIMKFSNGSEIVSLPSAQNPGRGFSGSLVIVDEWAFLNDPDAAWASIEPVADIGGQIIGLSTANGSGNFFHTHWVKSVAGETGFTTLFYPWSAVPGRDEAWYEQKRTSMPQWQLHQEYPSDPEEAFIRSGNPVFDLDVLKLQKPVVPTRGWLHEMARNSYTWRDDGGPLALWDMPDEKGVYVIGADVAEGLLHGDYSSAHVIDVRSARVVAHWHGHLAADLFGVELYKLGVFYNGALMCVEANNHGLTTITELRRLHYPNLYRRRGLNTTNQSLSQQYGWQTNKASKPIVIDDLGKALRTDLDVRDEYTVSELKTYVRDEAGRMGGSPFDDRVMSLAFANKMREHAFEPQYLTPKDNYMSMGWWMEQANPPKKLTVIGGNNVRHRT